MKPMPTFVFDQLSAQERQLAEVFWHKRPWSKHEKTAIGEPWPNTGAFFSSVPGQIDHAGYLGPKLCQGHLIIRAYFPGMERAELLDSFDQPVSALPLFQQNGLFVWLWQNFSFQNSKGIFYKIHTSKSSQAFADPYAFPPLLDEFTQYLWNQGALSQAYKNMGANVAESLGMTGWVFRVWAPNAKAVHLAGDFNNWQFETHPMRFYASAGLWELFLPTAKVGQKYKFVITSNTNEILWKADPYAFRMEHPPANASVLHLRQNIHWTDQNWFGSREHFSLDHQPLSIYEVHLGSWRHKGGRLASYQELETELVSYVKDMGFNFVEFMPLSEYPLDASWGYQPIGLFAPSVRFGTPEELKYLINAFHQAGLGVIMDWVPAHFPLDSHGLAKFDGSYLYEYQDTRKGYHPDWRTGIFNYSRREVLNYLTSNAFYWLDEFHIDGLRVDAVSSLLYWSYSRQPGEWEPNEKGGAENLEAVAFLKSLNTQIKQKFPGALMIAEESTVFHGVTKAVEQGGLGFDLKWNLGWMHDSLEYLHSDSDSKRAKHHQITHCIDYTYQEKFILPISHDEVVHGKSPMVGKIPGFDEQKFPLLRLYYAYQWSHPGKKLLFMGSEFAQRKEWQFAEELEWHLLSYAPHQGVQNTVRRLNKLYQSQPELFQADFDPAGFAWIKKDSTHEQVFAYLRKPPAPSVAEMLCILNFANQDYSHMHFGVSHPGRYQLIFHSGWTEFGGSLPEEHSTIESTSESWDGMYHSLYFPVQALSAIFYRYITE